MLVELALEERYKAQVLLPCKALSPGFAGLWIYRGYTF